MRHWFHCDPNELTLAQILGLVAKLPELLVQMRPAESHREAVERMAARRRAGDEELRRWLLLSSYQAWA